MTTNRLPLSFIISCMTKTNQIRYCSCVVTKEINVKIPLLYWGKFSDKYSGKPTQTTLIQVLANGIRSINLQIIVAEHYSKWYINVESIISFTIILFLVKQTKKALITPYIQNISTYKEQKIRRSINEKPVSTSIGLKGGKRKNKGTKT